MPETGRRWLRLVEDDAEAADRPLLGKAGSHRLAALRGQLRNHLVALREASAHAEARTPPDGAEAAALDRLAIEVMRLADGWDRLAAAIAALSAGDGAPPEE